ncbi:protein FAR1-RELATED SEQUENCE 5-like [Lycium barbarum]|uniref:protein FAR1-RELATED SEQUENCE 5-like n=1 Tax=Lycium barbarum TaxID=112863 RepID=UPI00293EB5A6|nr:protein FAR1-RELATED SEQUENCE 5-like [Lycium barbarum]
MNEDSEFNDSVGSHNGGEDTHMDGQAEETSVYSCESEEVYSDEQILAGPITGMFFKSAELVFRFYKRHVKMRGFYVLKTTLSKNYALFVCDKSRKPTNPKHTKRIGCEARVNAALKRDGSWIVTKVCRDHNPKLDSSLSRQMAGHRYIGKSVKRILEANDRAGLRPCKSVRLLEVQSGGPENMGCIPKDCRNYVEQQRLQMLGGDANALCQFFSDMQTNDNEFYYSMDMDGAGRIQSVVWVHSHSKYAYKEFGDLICFDTTYFVNMYNMPFASFVGINHHGQSIHLGCALFTSEDAEQYKIIFSKWKKSMNNVAPKAIWTDQCESINVGVSVVFEYTVHRYCIWHIFTKLPMGLKVTDGGYKTVKNEFKSIVLGSITIEEFEHR